MRRALIVVALAGTALAGCQSFMGPDQLVVIRNDGQPVAADAKAQRALAADRKLCAQRARRAVPGLAPAAYRGLDGTLTADMRQDETMARLIDRFDACMQRRGYMLVDVPRVGGRSSG